jgi:hypothetical protein
MLVSSRKPLSTDRIAPRLHGIGSGVTELVSWHAIDTIRDIGRYLAIAQIRNDTLRQTFDRVP